MAPSKVCYLRASCNTWAKTKQMQIKSSINFKNQRSKWHLRECWTSCGPLRMHIAMSDSNSWSRGSSSIWSVMMESNRSHKSKLILTKLSKKDKNYESKDSSRQQEWAKMRSTRRTRPFEMISIASLDPLEAWKKNKWRKHKVISKRPGRIFMKHTTLWCQMNS
jgi:hypothetical protein